MSIWKNILLRNVEGAKFKQAKTISSADHNKRFQIFEVLVTETLAIIDPNTQWKSLPVQGDEGIDFIGEIQQIEVPYLISKPKEIILGQIKRRQSSYKCDDFRYDIIKIIEHYNKHYTQQAALLEIIHVLSTDKNIDCTKWIENVTYPYFSYNVLPINAMDFLKFWKINTSFLSQQLDGIFTEKQMAPLLEYINGLQESWDDLIRIQIKTDALACIDDEIRIKICFNTSVDLALTLFLEWAPAEKNSNIAVIYPLNIIRNNISKYCVHVYKSLDFVLKMKAIQAGKQDLGSLCVYSPSGALISKYLLGQIDVQAGIVNKFYELPCKKQMEIIKGHILTDHADKFKSYVLTGQGGIGKSRLSQELCIFAQNKGYYIVSSQNANDFINSRNIVLELLIKLLDTQQTGIVSYYNIHESLRNKIGANFPTEWNKIVLDYITDCEISDINIEEVAKCIVSLLIIHLHEQPIFIWLSDMHWASKETIVLFKKIVNLLKLNKNHLKNSLVILFEGRDGDTLELEEKAIFPYEWLKFCENGNIEKLVMPVWNSDYSRDYIRMLINPMLKKEETQLELITIIEEYASGNPMHIKEFLHYLVELENVVVEKDGSLKLVNKMINLEFETLEIHQIILKRINFYHDKYVDIIDAYIVLSMLSANLRELYLYIKEQLSKKYYNYFSLEKNIGIISDTKTTLFSHEHYKEILRSRSVKSQEILINALNYYIENYDNDVNSKLDIITLQLLTEVPNFNAISKEAFGILQNAHTDYQALRCYQILLKVPSKFRGDVFLSEIYFEMSEIAIRIGSWKDSQKYLNRILDIQYTNENEFLYYILACKSLGNVYGVGLELEKSISICKNGLLALENKLLQGDFQNEAVKKEFQRQYEMLLNRIAVTYWFSGQSSLSTSYQETALELAKDRNDIYSISHTMYEMGMCQLHHNVILGHDNIKEALNILPGKSRYTESQERYLVRVELLISELLLYVQDLHNEITLNNILKSSEIICNELSVGNANYESSLCHIVNAVCYIINENYEKALDSFNVSLNCANAGEFTTLQWKLYLNMAETLLLICNQNREHPYYDRALHYAKRGRKILEDALQTNKNMPSFLALMEKPLYYFKTVLGEKTAFPQKVTEQSPICVLHKNYCFFIMD